MNDFDENDRSVLKGGNFDAKLTHLCSFWLMDVYFLTREKTSFAILIGLIEWKASFAALIG